METTNYRQQRLTELSGLPYELYPHKFTPSISLPSYIDKYQHLEKDEFSSEIQNVAGRIQSIRKASSKLYFIIIESDGVCLQVLANHRHYENVTEFSSRMRVLRRGDIIGTIGFPSRSTTGELSIVPKQVVLLAPCLHNIPKENAHVATLQDDGLRFARRYLDFIVHPEKRKIFEKRARIIAFFREYLNKLDFLEVETPSLSTKVGGANAKPFITHHNDLSRPMYMRIAPELWLKQLVIGGFNRVYEIGKQFRNESLDASHSTEFTSIEIYQAYADYHDMMQMTENILSGLVASLHKNLQITYDGTKIDFTTPFRRIPIIGGLEQHAGIVFPESVLNDFGSEESRIYLESLCEERGITCSAPRTTARMLDKLIGHYLEPLCDNPTFLTDHPQIMSPLAKYHRSDSILTERFELFINGREYANAYTELNNPITQESCFKAQAIDKEMGDVEAQMVDNDFVDALEHGLAPTGGLGFGIDRLVMLLTGETVIREVITFRPY